MFPHAAISDETFKGFCPDWAFPIKSDVHTAVHRAWCQLCGQDPEDHDPDSDFVPPAVDARAFEELAVTCPGPCTKEEEAFILGAFQGDRQILDFLAGVQRAHYMRRRAVWEAMELNDREETMLQRSLYMSAADYTQEETQRPKDKWASEPKPPPTCKLPIIREEGPGKGRTGHSEAKTRIPVGAKCWENLVDVLGFRFIDEEMEAGKKEGYRLGTLAALRGESFEEGRANMLKYLASRGADIKKPNDAYSFMERVMRDPKITEWVDEDLDMGEEYNETIYVARAVHVLPRRKEKIGLAEGSAKETVDNQNNA